MCLWLPIRVLRHLTAAPWALNRVDMSRAIHARAHHNIVPTVCFNPSPFSLLARSLPHSKHKLLSHILIDLINYKVHPPPPLLPPPPPEYLSEQIQVGSKILNIKEKSTDFVVFLWYHTVAHTHPHHHTSRCTKVYTLVHRGWNLHPPMQKYIYPSFLDALYFLILSLHHLNPSTKCLCILYY